MREGVAFLAVAEERSFTRAAKRVGVSRSALSHAVRGLEERIGVRLLSRTTRSVAPTDAGEQLIGRLRPALGDVESVLDQIAGLRERPAGRVRLVVSPLAATSADQRAAIDGVGLTFLMEEQAGPPPATGGLNSPHSHASPVATAGILYKFLRNNGLRVPRSKRLSSPATD